MTICDRITRLTSSGVDLTGYCIVRIYDTIGHVREFVYSNLDFARQRIDCYRNWKFFQAATLAVHDGTCWIEIPT